MKRLLFFISLIFIASACSIYHIESQEMTTNYYPIKKSPMEVTYLKTVDRPHDIIGTITVNAERRQRISDVIEKMKHQATLLGADAITNIQSDATGTWKKLPIQDLIGNAYVRANFTATAVVFR